MQQSAAKNSVRGRLLAATASIARKFKIFRAVWPAVLLSLTVSAGNVKAVEYEFSAPDGPLIWDFSGAYPPPLEMTLFQDADGGLVNNFGARGRVTGSASSVGLNFSLVSRLDYWRRIDSYTMEYVFQSSCATSLTSDRASRVLTGETRCTTLSQKYALFLFDWVPYRDLTTNYTTESVAVPLPAGADGHWKLALDIVSNGTQPSGTASITLASSNVIQFQITGTNATVTKSVLTLQKPYSINSLTFVVLGPEMSLQSVHGYVASQIIDYVAPVATSFLSLQINGSGRVRSLTNGQALVIGKDYTLNAASRPGNLFSNWIVAGIAVTNPTLRFTMISNLVITANFVTNAFIAANGVYNGLFSETNGVRQPSAGFFTLSLANTGAFSGNVSLDGGTHSFSGRFDVSGKSQLQVRRGSKPALTVSLEINFEAQEIHGTVSDGNWTAELFADRAYSKAATNYLGVYTMVISGDDSATDFLGDGIATLWIDFFGTIHLTGTLADGTHFNRSVKISRNGLWPFYVPLYGNKGSIMSWICFSNQPASSLGGDLIWFKPAKSSGKFYPVGFTNQTSAIGSSFWGPGPSNGRLQLNFTNGVLILAGGNLPSALTNTLDNSGTAGGTSRVGLKWNVIDGSVSGSFVHPATGRSTSLRGVLLQNQNVARGHFLGTNQSGSFILYQ
jgi:Divergent InlB B-repeat domain